MDANKTAKDIKTKVTKTKKLIRASSSSDALASKNPSNIIRGFDSI